MQNGLKGLIIITSLIAAGLALWVGPVVYFAFSKGPTPAREYTVQIQRKANLGETIRATADLLQQQGVVSDAKKFIQLGRWLRKWNQVKAGEYRVNSSQTPIEIFSILTSGISVAYPLTIREGDNIYQVGDAIDRLGLLSKAQFVALCKSPAEMKALGFKPPLPPSLEGYLFPETYFLDRTLSPQQILQRLVGRFQMEWDLLKPQIPKNWKFSRHQTVTLASMIEKETGAPQERPLISSVFHNRLHKRMRLQSDPTTIYGIWERYAGNLHREDLRTETPFNTYAIAALPIGPIANPGREALLAAVRPAKSDYLYFVSHNDGTHEFSKTFEDHSGAVKKFQLDRKAREGKSWRDLKKAK